MRSAHGEEQARVPSLTLQGYVAPDPRTVQVRGTVVLGASEAPQPTVLDAKGPPKAAPQRVAIMHEDPRQALFRERALHAYLHGADRATVLRVADPTWRGVLLALASLVLCSVLFLAFGHVDITCKGPGVLRVSGGAREVQANSGGLVRSVAVHSGQHVQAGDVLLTLDATQARVAALEAERRLAFVQRELDALLSRGRETTAHSQQLLEREANLVTRRIGALRESIARHQDQLATLLDLHRRGLVATTTVDELEERVQAETRAQLALDAELLQLRSKLLGVKFDEDKQRYHWLSEQEAARGELEAARAALREASITAPSEGTVEAMVVQPGELVRPGQLVGKLLPRGTPDQIVAFVRERDRAFSKPGDRARIELTQLPAAEFGVMHARVRRISDDIASGEEIAEALGPQQKFEEAHYRVELSTERDGEPALRAKLRPGMLIEARFVLRRRLLLALIVDPIRRWSE